MIEAGLHQTQAPPGRAALGDDPALDRRVAKALASIDVDRARHHAGALGVVDVAVGANGLVATPHAATLEPHAPPPLDLQLRGWDLASSWGQLPARGMDVLAALAGDAGHRGGPIVVTPAPQLAVVAGYLPATTSEPARLVVNPVALAALEPHDPAAVERTARTAAAASPVGAATEAANAAGNPYSFYGSVAECAAAQRNRCDACLADGSCTAITNLGDGNAECTQLAANGGRGYYLICINLALAIDAVASCTASGAPSCPRATHASDSISSLEANAGFLDDVACARPLDACLATLYGGSNGGFPGPGSDPGTSPPPRNTSIGCGDWSNDANCDASPGCELDGPSCDAPQDGACSSSNEQSGCGDSGGGGGGGDSSCGSEDSCGSQDNSTCDSSDCGGGGNSDCSSGGGDCSGGGGGDCSGGGGGDCGGGGGDCNIAGRRGRVGASLPVAVMWALLPIPFATIVRRRAERRRARAACAEAGTDAESEVAP